MTGERRAEQGHSVLRQKAGCGSLRSLTPSELLGPVGECYRDLLKGQDKGKTSIRNKLGRGGGDLGMTMLSVCSNNPNKRRPNAILFIYYSGRPPTTHLILASIVEAPLG